MWRAGAVYVVGRRACAGCGLSHQGAAELETSGAARARSLCCPVRPCAARNRAERGTRRAAQGTRARGAARFCTLMTQPAPDAGSPTDDIHSACTPRVSPPGPALLPSTPAGRPPLSPLRSQSPSHAPPTRSRQPARLASPCPRLRLAGLSRPPAHRATRALRLELCDRRSSSQPLTPTARRCPSSASPPRLAAPARSPRPPYCVPFALPPLPRSPSEPCPLPLLPPAPPPLST